ncbi:MULTISPECIES: SMI1/KNR4 family protein [Bacillus]|uniref:SMI1/KNR4 family protein n=1 Tax=Bacillus TaxID=1386 RepID=UPI0004691B12|nr:SMI1/KNR4 family protein [Bacillus paramycoides]
MIGQLKKIRKRTIILTVIMLLLTVIVVRNSTWYISRSFSSEFFQLPMPLDSKVIKDYEVDEKNWIEIGNGDLFGYSILNGIVQRDDIHVWNHENDSRTWVAPSLETFMEWWESGKITI